MAKVDLKGRPVQERSYRRWILALAIVMLGSGAAWGGWYYMHRSTLDPAVMAKLTEIRQQLSSGVTLSPDQRRKLMDEMRKQRDQLPPEQRQQLQQQGREMMRKEMEKRAREFFALPPDQRTAALDKTIDEMEKWRQAFQQSRPQGGGAQGGGAQGNRGPNAGRPARTQDQQIASRVNRLNNSSPQTRAYMQQLMQRRQQRGLPGFGGRPR